MSFYTGSLLSTSIASLALGLFVYFKGKAKLPNITLGLLSASIALWCFAQFMGEVAATKTAVLYWTRGGIAAAVCIPVFFLHFTLSLVDRLDRERKVIYAVYGLGLLFFALDLSPYFVMDVSPIMGYRYYPQAGLVYPFFAVFLFVCFGYGFWRLVLTYTKSSGARRNQLLYVLFACLIGFSGGSTTFFPIWNVNFPVLSHFALPLYLLITVYAILKHRLLDISIIVRQGLIYSALTLLFAGFYALVILSANYWLAYFIPFSPVVTILLVVFVSVLVFQPLKDRVQGLVDRLFSMGEYRYRKTINDLSIENQQLLKSLLRADKLASLGTMSAGMAHEIKNPLASIKGLTQVLDENLDDPEFIRKYQAVLDRQIERINNIVEKLLKFGRPQHLEIGDIDLNQLIDDVLALFEAQCQKNNIKISRPKIGLPKIVGDAEQMTQVLTNLVLNAIEAMPDGGQLMIEAKAKGSGIEIKVEDTGVGIGADKIDSIFDPFYSNKEQGTGMGLAVAYRSIKGHNGDIQVESQLGKGTKFTLWLPIKQKQ